MKFLMPSLLVMSALLSACANNSDSKNGGYAFTEDFKPNTRPGGAASEADLKDLLAVFKDSSKFVPDKAAIYDAVIDDSQTKSTYGTPERQEALNKLNNDGTRFLEQVKNRCRINNATLRETGNNQTPYKGLVTTKNLSMSLEGQQCPMLHTETNSMTMVYDDVQIGRDSAAVKMHLNSSTLNHQEVRDERMVQLNGVRSVSIKMDLSGAGEATATARSNESKVKASGSGVLKIVLANGETIAGNMKIETFAINNVSSMQVLFEANTSKGAVRIVVIKNANEELKAYLNGSRINPRDWEDIGFKVNQPK